MVELLLSVIGGLVFLKEGEVIGVVRFTPGSVWHGDELVALLVHVVRLCMNVEFIPLRN